MPISSASTATRSTASWCCCRTSATRSPSPRRCAPSDLGVPVLIQASNDEIDKVDVRSRRDAFCGKISVTNNLYQYGIPFTDTTSHTVDVDSAEFAADLDRFGRICRTVRGLQPRPHRRHRRAHRRRSRPCASAKSCCRRPGSPWSPSTCRRSSAPPPHSRTMRRRSRRSSTRSPPTARSRRTSSPSNIVKQAKWTIAVDRWIAENECDASAIQCWRSLQDNFGCATCLTMSMMGEKLMPSACEVDVMGAVSMYALALASGRAAGDPRLEQQLRRRGRQVRVHALRQLSRRASSASSRRSPSSTCSALSCPKEKCFGAVKGKVKAGPMTFFRVSSDDRNGTLKSYVGEGEFTDDPFPMDGGIAVTQRCPAAAAARLHRAERLRASRRHGARPSRGGRSTRRSPATSTGRPTTTKPNRRSSATLHPVFRR